MTKLKKNSSIECEAGDVREKENPVNSRNSQ